MIQKTVSYERISPAVLANIIENRFACMVMLADVNKDYFSISVFAEDEELEKINIFLEKY